MSPASVPSTPGSALGPPSGRGRRAAASGHATSAFSNEAEAAPLLREAATPRTPVRASSRGLPGVHGERPRARAGARRARGDDAVAVGGCGRRRRAIIVVVVGDEPFADGAGSRLGSTAAEAARGARRHGRGIASAVVTVATRELPAVDAFGERDAGMMDGSGRRMAQLEERAERQRRWQDRIARRQSERDRGTGDRAPGNTATPRFPTRSRAPAEKEASERGDRDARPGATPVGASDRSTRCSRASRPTGTRTHAINTLIANYADAHDRFGMDVRVVVWVSDSRFATFRTDGARAATSKSAWATARSDTTSPACAARRSGRTSMATSTPTTWSARTTSTSPRATWSAVPRAQAPERHARDDLHPMLVRYEDLVDTGGTWTRTTATRRR